MANTIALSQKSSTKPYLIAWGLGLLFYFLEYAVRSSPSVMIGQLSSAFNVSALRISTVLGLYYYTYSTISLAAGAALDRVGAHLPVSIGVCLLGIGCFLFAAPSVFAGDTGRLLQGAGSAFAFPGCVYLATRGFPPQQLATAIGFTQCFGMLGGSAGQFVVAPMIANGLSISSLWFTIGTLCLIVCLSLFFLVPKETKTTETAPNKKQNFLTPYKIVFSNPQSYLCGIVSGLLFAPTTIFAMTWGVAFFEHDRGFAYRAASVASSMVPLGWVVGCPLLGWLADKGGRRKPVLIGGCVFMMLSLLQLLYAPLLLPAGATLFVFGVGSGAAMLPYSVIKEVNPDKVKGSATGAINFLTFGVTTLLGPLFAAAYGRTLETTTDPSLHFQRAGLFWVGTTALAVFVSLFLRETGRAAALSTKGMNEGR